ncbi:MAG: fimbrillin family protein [Prevotella sp.]|nr:fimbrillin family protein [Prevotella sp.]
MRTNDLFLTAAAASMMMLAACTHDDGTASISEPTPVGNELIISTRHSEMGITRAESNIQESQFADDEEIHVFLRDADEPTEGTVYNGGEPLIYKKTTGASGSNRIIKTYSSGTTENRLFWPKLMHSLDIFGVYPKNTVTTSTKVGDTFAPFDKTKEYNFTVAVNQDDSLSYKNSDLMTGLPTNYNSVHAGSYDASDAANDAPFKLKQNENPGTIPLTFTHRLTKIIINVTKTTDTQDTDIPLDDIKYTGTDDTKYALVTLTNVLRKTKFKVNSNDGVLKTDATEESPNNIVVGKGQREITITGGYRAVSLAAIVPPQTITKGTNLIKVDLKDGETTTDEFIYKIPGGISDQDLELEPATVYTYNIRINKPHIDVSISIAPWLIGAENQVVGELQ